MSEPDRRSIVTARTLTTDEAEGSFQTVWIFAGEGEPVCQTACFSSTRCVEIIRFPGPTTDHNSVNDDHQKQHEVGPA